MLSWVFDAIGTKWQIDINSSLPVNKRIFLEKLIRKRIDEFDKTYSRFRSDSLIRKLAVKKGKYLLPPDGDALFKFYDQLYKLTGGLFTPLIGQVLVDAGYDETYSLKPKKLHHPLSWDEVLNYYPPDNSRHPASPYVIIKKPSILDFGAAGKGYLIDIVSEILEEKGVASYCIDAGGDIRYRNDKKRTLRVGLENPDNFQQVIGVAEITNESICGSAGNRRKWGKYHHIIDPFTLSSPQTILATWVIAPTTMPGTSRYPTMLADGLATCLFFVSPEILLNKFSFEYIIMYSDYSIMKSVGFNGELFVNE